MKFDYTYILLFGFKVFEPMVIVTNTIFFALCILFFQRLRKYNLPYAVQMAWFILLLGTSSIFGAIGHAVHEQLGDLFFKTILFCMNALSLFSIYFCFRAAYTYLNINKEPSRLYIYLVMIWLTILLIACAIKGNFILIMIHGGLVLLFSLIAHYLVYNRKNDRGSALVVLGIAISFLPIIVHSLKFSLHEWFNHKDLAHVIMIVSLIVIYKGVCLIASELRAGSVTTVRNS